MSLRVQIAVVPGGHALPFEFTDSPQPVNLGRFLRHRFSPPVAPSWCDPSSHVRSHQSNKIEKIGLYILLAFTM